MERNYYDKVCANLQVEGLCRKADREQDLTAELDKTNKKWECHWECHWCGDITTITAYDIPHLCQHTLNICDNCLPILKKHLFPLDREQQLTEEVERLKKKLFEAIYPKIPYVVKTQKDLW